MNLLREEFGRIQFERPILVIANLDLWNGHRSSYKLIQSGKLSDILYGFCSGMSECHWYCDGSNICCDESHHDGTNHYIYREVKRDNIDLLLNRIYYGEEVTSSMLNYYTKSLAKDVVSVFGI